jgi:nucleoside-diphosphate-sugar epimerase
MSELKNMQIAMTGGSGFVGSTLAQRFASDNDVRVLDLGVHGQGQLDIEGVQTVLGDVRDSEVVANFVRGADVVIHLASIAGVASVMSMPVTTMETILLGAQNVLRAAAGDPRIKRVILFSTSEVAGRFAYNVGEDATLSGARAGEMRWTYAVAKLASEFHAAAFHIERKVPTVCLRPFNIYGPGQLGSGAIREFAKRAIAGEKLSVRGEGAQIRAWCYIEDVADAVELCCLRDQAVGQVFNVGNPRSVVTVAELAKLVVRLAESDSAIEFVPNPEVDVELRVPDISRARELLGFEPKVDLEEGIARTLTAFREITPVG